MSDVRGWMLAAVVMGCSSEPARVDFKRVKPAVATPGAAVARFGNDSISEGELAQRLAEMNPYARGRFQSAEAKRDFVDGLVRFELVAQEAVRRGLASDPEVVEATKRVLVQVLLRKELDERADAISDAQVAAYYAEHRGDYVKPAMTRLSHIAFAKADRATAEAVLKQVKALAPGDHAAFSGLVRQHSVEPRTKPLDGDLRFLSDEELAAQYGAPLVAAAAELKEAGAVVPTLVETDSALHVVRLQGRQIALNLSVEQAAPSIRQTILDTTRRERMVALLERLKRQAGYTVDEAALARVPVDLKAPTAPAKGPPPGYLPAPAADR
ncbi:MAG: peptidyl-prolyl cis-trans isomerase [Archangium sp.]|nr:peptidyl-prolyl cis-trans isomerase [Archangium sp.]